MRTQVIEPVLTAQEIISGFEIMDKSIAKALETGNADDLYDYHFQSTELMRRMPTFKGHCHLPDHLVYLKDQFHHLPQYDFKNSSVYRYDVIGWKRINDNF